MPASCNDEHAALVMLVHPVVDLGMGTHTYEAQTGQFSKVRNRQQLWVSGFMSFRRSASAQLIGPTRAKRDGREPKGPPQRSFSGMPPASIMTPPTHPPTWAAVGLLAPGGGVTGSSSGDQEGVMGVGMEVRGGALLGLGGLLRRFESSPVIGMSWILKSSVMNGSLN